jgi:hypothetical protein
MTVKKPAAIFIHLCAWQGHGDFRESLPPHGGAESIFSSHLALDYEKALAA